MLKNLLAFFFPPLCPVCEKIICEGICSNCREGIRLIKGPLCTICGVPFVSNVSSDHICSECIKKKKPFSHARSAGIYVGTLLEAIHMLKYKGKTSLAKPLGVLMADYLHENDYDVLVPVPLHKTRLKERGFNHSLLLGRIIARRHNLHLDYLNLIRARATMPQIDLKGNARASNVRGAFEVKKTSLFMDKKVLLIDDVYTTGATVSECAKVLKKAGAREIGVFTLARVVDL
jgi:ComF family protein